MTDLNRGMRVRVVEDFGEYGGRTGTIYNHLPSRPAPWHVCLCNEAKESHGDCVDRCAFKAGELIPLMTLTDALNNESEATATATNEAGVTVEVTYSTGMFGGTPLWTWYDPTVRARYTLGDYASDHLGGAQISYEFDWLSQRLFEDYDLDADAAIWTRKQPEHVTAE